MFFFFLYFFILFFFFFQAEDGIRDYKVTGVQTCALPIYGTRGKSYKAAEKSDGKYKTRKPHKQMNIWEDDED